MKIFNSLEEIKDIESTVIAVGNFDGVHKGHQEIIGRTIREAQSIGCCSAVFTFSNHPRNLLGEDHAVKNIQYASDKIAIFEEMGVEYLFTIPFEKEIMETEPEDYIKDILLGKMKMQEIFCGFNYHFGHKAAGDVSYLVKKGMELGFGTHVLEPFKIDDQVISSTLIRQLISQGEMEQCQKFLGRFYNLGGIVVKGNQIGRTIGFPTCNLEIDKSMVTPPNGVYISYCVVDGYHYPSVTNVGVKPTIGGHQLKNIETHLFDFNGDLYDQKIRVEFVRKIREEEKFDSLEALSTQIDKDCIAGRVYHREHVIKQEDNGNFPLHSS